MIEELRRDESTKLLPVLAVAQNDDLEERIGLLEAGADDVITKPFDQTELEARVEALSLRFQRSRDRSALVVADDVHRRRARPPDRVRRQPQGRRRDDDDRDQPRADRRRAEPERRRC